MHPQRRSLHFWEQMFGSGRADPRHARRATATTCSVVKKVTDFQYVRFHAIFDDDNGVYDEDAQGNPVYNFSYVDQIYDGLLANGVRPFVEISFMPKKLASQPDTACLLVPAERLAAQRLRQMGRSHHRLRPTPHRPLRHRRSLAVVLRSLERAQHRFLDRRAHAADLLRALRPHRPRAQSRQPAIRVGGPATAQAAWVGDMIAHATQNHVPLDFVSTHVYGNDTSQDVFGDNRPVAPHQMVSAAVEKVHDEIKASARPTFRSSGASSTPPT